MPPRGSKGKQPWLRKSWPRPQPNKSQTVSRCRNFLGIKNKGRNAPSLPSNLKPKGKVTWNRNMNTPTRNVTKNRQRNNAARQERTKRNAANVNKANEGKEGRQCPSFFVSYWNKTWTLKTAQNKPIQARVIGHIPNHLSDNQARQRANLRGSRVYRYDDNSLEWLTTFFIFYLFIIPNLWYSETKSWF